MTLVSSCIVADPPTYTDPGVTRPELAAIRAVPPVYQVFVIQTPTSSTPTFSVPVRSEDAGEQLLVNFWRDFGTSSVKPIGLNFVPPSTYNDTSDREITFPWSTLGADDQGCHTVSMVVAHLSSYTTPQEISRDNLNKDGAIITWWVNVNPDPSALNTLVGCPSQQQTVTK